MGLKSWASAKSSGGIRGGKVTVFKNREEAHAAWESQKERNRANPPPADTSTQDKAMAARMSGAMAKSNPARVTGKSGKSASSLSRVANNLSLKAYEATDRAHEHPSALMHELAKSAHEKALSARTVAGTVEGSSHQQMIEHHAKSVKEKDAATGVGDDRNRDDRGRFA